MSEELHRTQHLERDDANRDACRFILRDMCTL